MTVNDSRPEIWAAYIEVANQPSKMYYPVGESTETDGLKVIAHYIKKKDGPSEKGDITHECYLSPMVFKKPVNITATVVCPMKIIA